MNAGYRTAVITDKKNALEAIHLNLSLHLGSHTNFCVAYSGGMDSHVLLHALHCLRANNALYHVRAVHVHHGISPYADAWAHHCATVCQQLSIPLSNHVIHIKKAGGKSLEALARDARYDCLGQQLHTNEALLTAHHADDQAETILLQLLRGSGVAGLSAMPETKKIFDHILLRPLLHVPRSTLYAYATTHHLSWIEDDSNQSLHYNRNYIRQHITPLLKARWPAMLQTLARSAQHCAEAQALCHDMAAQDYEQVRLQGNAIDVRFVQKFSILRQRQLIRYWIQQHGFLLPSTVQLETLLKTVIHSRYDAKPVFTWGGYTVKRNRYSVHCILSTKSVDKFVENVSE